jgi:uncharacterized FAD-dependent dehydrogenase
MDGHFEVGVGFVKWVPKYFAKMDLGLKLFGLFRSLSSLKITLSNWTFDQAMDETSLAQAFARLKGVQMTTPREVKILKESMDKRKGLRYVYTVELEVGEMVDLERMSRENKRVQIRKSKVQEPVPQGRCEALVGKTVVVVGAGPAGMFAADTLAETGAKVILLERGEAVRQRLDKVRRLFKEAHLNGESNICFGEGGAGTFSDGKLTTRKNHPWIRYVLDYWVDLGAPPEIAVAGKPHIGTDRLRAVVVRMRKKLLSMGVDIRFDAKVTDLVIENGAVSEVIVEGHESILAPEAVIWATGHSARDSFHMLHKRGVPMESKPFAVGVRIEHPQELVNQWLHGDKKKQDLGAADYRVVCNISEDRSVYSFCMCPGGQVVCSSSHDGYHVVNGMSNYARNSAFANSGLVVKVGEQDFPGGDAMSGIRFQEDIEKKAYELAGGYLGPAQTAIDFLEGRVSASLPASSYVPGLVSVDLNEVLPKAVCENLKRALLEFEDKHPGFAGPQALLIGTETRTSSPLRIPRLKEGYSDGVSNFYPCGEGAGYAGGIISAALDGLFMGQCLRKRYE